VQICFNFADVTGVDNASGTSTISLFVGSFMLSLLAVWATTVHNFTRPQLMIHRLSLIFARELAMISARQAPMLMVCVLQHLASAVFERVFQWLFSRLGKQHHHIKVSVPAKRRRVVRCDAHVKQVADRMVSRWRVSPCPDFRSRRFDMVQGILHACVPFSSVAKPPRLVAAIDRIRSQLEPRGTETRRAEV
jgi:hypothetical protein